MNRSTHPVENEELMAYLDGELAVERGRGVASHLEQCAECQALAAEFRFVYQQMAAWQVGPSPACLVDHVAAAVQGHPPQQIKQTVRQPSYTGLLARALVRPWVWKLAAATALVVLVGWLSLPNLFVYRGTVPFSQPAPSSENRANARAILGQIKDQPASRNEISQSPAAQLSAPMIVRTASLVLVTKQFEKTRTAIETIVTQHHGYVAQLTVNAQAGAARALTANLRIPADQLDASLAELKKLGRVEEESQGGAEVTQQYVDLNARLKNARSTERRLIDVLRERTGKVKDILAVEEEIARVRGEIEQMEAESKNLEHQVRYATLQLRLSEDYKAELEVTPPSTGTRLQNSLVEGYRSAVGSVLDVVMVLFSGGPTLLLWILLLFWPARAAWRRLRALTTSRIVPAVSNRGPSGPAS